jgi:hypothetical protein
VLAIRRLPYPELSDPAKPTQLRKVGATFVYIGIWTSAAYAALPVWSHEPQRTL